MVQLQIIKQRKGEEAFEWSIETILLVSIFVVLAGILLWYSLTTREIQQELPKFNFNANAMHAILGADCIAGEKKFSFSAAKMDPMNSGEITCFKDLAVLYKISIFTELPYYEKEWKFQSSNFDYHSDDDSKPKSVYSRGILIEDGGKYYPGALVAYIVTVKDIECQYKAENGNMQQC